jgi:DNA-binding transcriptional LysR family regulator
MKERLAGMSVFAQVVEAKSFSAAAEELGMSKSLASRHVSALEASLGVRLLHRSTRKLALTEAGAVFYEHCARIVQEAQEAEERLTRVQSEPSGLVRVTATPALAVRYVLPALADFRRQHPRIVVKLSCSNRRIDLGEEGFDMGIRVSFAPAPNLVARKLAPNPSVICAAPSYLEGHGTPRRLDDLRKHECVIFQPLAPKGAWTLRRGGTRHTVQVAGAFETDEIEAVREALERGMGIGALPSYIAADPIAKGRLVPILTRFQLLPESAIYLVYLPNRTLSSRVRALIDFLVAKMGSG